MTVLVLIMDATIILAIHAQVCNLSSTPQIKINKLKEEFNT